jgi:putative ATPase
MHHLSERLRPSDFSQLLRQSNSRLEGVIAKVQRGEPIPSMILYGPPGVGKTSIARLFGKLHGASFFEVSGATQGIKDLREIIEASGVARPVIFVDEIHRFTRTQQDFLLPLIESGAISCIGATTEAPSFYLSRALLSRMILLIIEPIPPEGFLQLAPRIREVTGWDLDSGVLTLLGRASGGDIRRFLSMIEELGEPFDRERVSDFLQKAGGVVPTDEELHYQLASAFIKSLRGSHADAALYYGFRMLESGDDPRFLFRRMIIFASEDVGNADPRALEVAVAGFEGFERVGMPEGRIPLAQVITYLAGAPKSNRSYMAMKRAVAAVKQFPHARVPLALRNASHLAAKMEGAHVGYIYPHDEPEGYTADIEYLPEELQGVTFYEPSDRGYETRMKERWEWLRTRKIK